MPSPNASKHSAFLGGVGVYDWANSSLMKDVMNNKKFFDSESDGVKTRVLSEEAIKSYFKKFSKAPRHLEESN